MDITSNPWVVTSADVAATALTVWTGKALITNIEFSGYAATTDSATVNQTNGKLLAFLSASSDLEMVRTGDVRHTDGIQIPLGGITNGSVKIYHK